MNVIETFEELETLDLKEKRIESIEPYLFAGLHELTELNLSSN